MKNFEVKIYSSATTAERWYVYIYDVQTKKIIQKIYKGVNKEKDFHKRMVLCRVFKEELEKELKNGWKPVKGSDQLPQPYDNIIDIVSAYEKAYKILLSFKREPRTVTEYTTHKRFFLNAVKELNWSNHRFIDLDQYHFKMILEKMVEIRRRGNTYFNKHLKICKAFCTALKNEYVIKESKVIGIPKKEYKTEDKRLLTPKEQTIVINHFKEVCPQFITLLKVLYHLDLRPKEIRLLKVGMIDQEKWYFSLPETITKNDKKAYILIPDDLKKDLIKLDLSNPDNFLFGVAKTWGRDRSEDFLPSKYMISRDSTCKLWRKEVKEYLKIDSDMYSLKKKNNNDKLKRGWGIEEVKEVNRHSSIEMTKIYATEYSEIVQEKHRDNYGTFS